MPKLYIPSIGDTITLTKPWAFQLTYEWRNKSLWEHLGKEKREDFNWRKPRNPLPVTLPKGTKLKLDRIYIRKGRKPYDSISFNLVGAKTERRTVTTTINIYTGGYNQPPLFRPHSYKTSAQQVRFWVKLEDANKIVYSPEPQS